MATLGSEPGGVDTINNLTTVFTKAATDSGDITEWQPGGDITYWHGDDVTRWSDEEDGGLAAAQHAAPWESDIRKQIETETEQMNTVGLRACTRAATNVGSGDTSPPSNRELSDGNGDISNISPESRGITASAEAASGGGLPVVCHRDDREAQGNVNIGGGVLDAAAGGMENIEGAAYRTKEIVNTLSTASPVPQRPDVVGSTAGASLTPAESPVSGDLLSAGGGSVDEVDAVHPRLTQGAARRRRSSVPAFVCDTCRRDTSGWQDCVDHAYRSGHGLAARCALCRLPAVRCRRRGRPGVWHRCAVVDTVRKLGAGNIAALVAGSHLTAPRPWRLSCGECGASFAAKTSRLVRHVVERGHSVKRHCEKCLFPVFVFGLNDEKREMHVCVGNSAWLRAEEGALLATAPEGDATYSAERNEGVIGEERGDGQGMSGGGTPTNDHRLHLPQPRLSRYHSYPNGSAAHLGEDITSDRHHRHLASNTADGITSGHGHGRLNGDLRGGGGGGGVISTGGEVRAELGDSNGSVPRENGRAKSLASARQEQWSEDRAPSCVAI